MYPMIDLAVGDPAGGPPPRIKEVFHNAIHDPGANHYVSLPGGLTTTSEAAAGYYKANHDHPVDPENVVITHGARPAIRFGIEAADRRGKLCGYFVPAYTYFPSLIRDAGMVPMAVPLFDKGMSKAQRKAAFAKLRDGVFLLNNPHNPTGRNLKDEELEEIVKLAFEYRIKVVSDFVYADLYERARPKTVLALDPNAIEIISISKPFKACGYRAGAVIGEKSWVAALKAQYAAMNGVPYAIQRVAECAWSEMPGVDDFRADIIARRAAVVPGLRHLGFEVDTETENQSGMFVWARVPSAVGSSKMLRECAAAAGVLVSEGSSFGDGFDQFIRLALNEPTEVLKEAVTRIGSAVEYFHEAA
jgi:LL-diaminopimelate aminotransferase